jgi:hypothetical protein
MPPRVATFTGKVQALADATHRTVITLDQACGLLRPRSSGSARTPVPNVRITC